MNTTTAIVLTTTFAILASAKTPVESSHYQFQDLPVIPDGIQEHGKPGYVISSKNIVTIGETSYTYKKIGLKHCLYDVTSSEKTMEGWYKYNASDGKSLFYPVNPQKTGSAVVTVKGVKSGVLHCSGVPVALGRDASGTYKFDVILYDVVLKRSESATDAGIKLLLEQQKDKIMVYEWLGDDLIHNGNVVTNSQSLYLDAYGSFFNSQNAKSSDNLCPLFREITALSDLHVRFFVIRKENDGSLRCEYLKDAKRANPPKKDD